MDPYRVFISHSSKDRKLVKEIAAIIEQNGMQPMWDEIFIGGHGFPDQIKNFIAQSHVFVPVITRASSKRGWVHQEIGYAMALNIPILPVTLKKIPGEMLQHLQAIPWRDHADLMKTRLSFDIFEKLVKDCRRRSKPLYKTAELHEHRTQMMVEYAEKVKSLGYFGHVRQKGALSSFHIPDKRLDDIASQQRYGEENIERFRYRCEELGEERRILEKHAREKGCSIIIDPYLDYKDYGPKARKVRLQSLQEFLQSMPDHLVQAVIYQKMPAEESVTIVGNWFLAESVKSVMGAGYQQTIFTRHAPTIQDRIDKFDDEFQALLDSQESSGQSSREYVMQVIQAEIDQLS